MDQLIHIELLDRHGRVASRHAARTLPLRIGRAYDNHLVLDDPYAAPYHAVVQRTPTGDLEIVDAGSRNGLFRAGAKRRFGRERVDPSARYRAGRTEFRLRSGMHPVAAELPDRGARGLREPLVALGVVLAVLSALVLDAWSETGERGQLAKLVLTPVLAAVALLVWAGAWALAGRLLSGERRVAAHVAVASLALIGILLANRLDYVAFALSAPQVDFLGLFAIGAALAWGLRRHLALATGRPGRGTALAAVAVAAACVGLFALLAQLWRADDPTRMAYLKHIKPPEVRLVEGSAPGAFFSDAGRIRGELEALKAR
jgi:hypothetical protein